MLGLFLTAMEWFGLEGIVQITWLQAPCLGKGQTIRLWILGHVGWERKQQMYLCWCTLPPVDSFYFQSPEMVPLAVLLLYPEEWEVWRKGEHQRYFPSNAGGKKSSLCFQYTRASCSIIKAQTAPQLKVAPDASQAHVGHELIQRWTVWDAEESRELHTYICCAPSRRRALQGQPGKLTTRCTAGKAATLLCGSDEQHVRYTAGPDFNLGSPSVPASTLCSGRGQPAPSLLQARGTRTSVASETCSITAQVLSGSDHLRNVNKMFLWPCHISQSVRQQVDVK